MLLPDEEDEGEEQEEAEHQDGQVHRVGAEHEYKYRIGLLPGKYSE